MLSDGVRSRREILADLLRFVGSDGHILRAHPQLFFQQATNQPDTTATAGVAQHWWRAGGERRPWFKVLNKAQYRDPCLLTVGGQGSHLAGCAFSGNGGQLRSVLRDGSVTTWELPSGSESAWARIPDTELLGCVFSPDGERFAAYSPGRGIGIYDARQPVITPGLSIDALPHFFPDVFAWSPSARTIVSGRQSGKLELWSETAGACLVEAGLHDSDVFACAMSRDGRWVASGSGRWNEDAGEMGGWSVGGYDRGELCLWNTETNDMRALHGHRNLISACVFSQDGEWVATGSRDGSLLVWEVRTGRAVTLAGHPGANISACAFSPDAERLVSASNDQTLKVWDLTRGSEVASLAGHSAEVAACLYSPDGRRLLSGAITGELKLWDTELVEAAGTSPLRTPATRCTYSPEGREILCSTTGQTLEWLNGDTGQPGGRERIQGEAAGCGYTPDGDKMVAAFWSMVEVWNARTHQWLVAFEQDERLWRSPLEGPRTTGWPEWMTGTRPLVSGVNFVRSFALAPDGQRLAIGWQDGKVRLWHATSFVLLASLEGHTDSIRACCFSPDGRHIVSASDDHTLRVWDVEGGTELVTLRGHPGGVSACAYSPDGRRIVSASDDGTIRVWDAVTGKAAAVMTGHAPFAICPESRRLLCAADERSLRVFDLASGGELLRLPGHRGQISECRFSPDSQWIVSGSEDGTLRLWGADSGAPVATFAAGSAINSFAVRGAGGSLAVGPNAGGLQLLDVIGVSPLAPVVTPVRWYRADRQAWDAQASVRCPWCADCFVAEGNDKTPATACPGCGKGLRIQPIGVDGRSSRFRRGELRAMFADAVVGAGLVVVGLLAGTLSPWLWIVGAPMALLGSGMLVFVVLRASHTAVPVRCSSCHGPAIKWRGREVLCQKCGRREIGGR